MSPNEMIENAAEIAGELEAPEIAQLHQLQAQANACYNQIGQLEVRKAAMLGRVGQIESQGQQVMDGIAARVGIAKGTPWKLTADNKIQVLAAPKVSSPEE